MEIIADGTNQITEADENNNTLTNSTTCTGQPDLIIENIKFSGSAMFYRIINAGQVLSGPSGPDCALTALWWRKIVWVAETWRREMVKL